MISEKAHTANYSARHPERRVLVTGATGYVGGRVIPELLRAGFTVRASSRSIDSLRRFDWFDDIEPVEADLMNPDDVRHAMENVDVVLYLVHSMGSSDQDFEEAEKQTATAIASAASDASVRQIIYLSGLHPRGKKPHELSKHMRSRDNVATILHESPVPTLTLRAATLIGSGSASFEIIRHLVERLPIMVTPNWINNRIEPLAIRDALYYLVRASDLDDTVNEGFDIGSGDVLRFKDLMKIYAHERGLRRIILPSPLSLPVDRLSGMWIGFVTPVPSSIAKPLAESMAENAVTDEHNIAHYIPEPDEGLTSYTEAVRLAITHDLNGGVPTSWDSSWTVPDEAQYTTPPHSATTDSTAENSATGDALPAEISPTDPSWAGNNVYQDVRSVESDLSPEQIWPVIEGIGGDNGWYSAPLLWRIRGILDKLFGGPGLGGRRDPVALRRGDRVDWWRVEKIVPNRCLGLKAEMKLRGEAWLVLEVEPCNEGTTRPRSQYRQRAIYEPDGLLGRLYWWGVYPFHAVIFPVMAKNILKRAQEESEGTR